MSVYLSRSPDIPCANKSTSEIRCFQLFHGLLQNSIQFLAPPILRAEK